MVKTDLLLIGCGVIEISISRKLKARYPDLSICILEKHARSLNKNNSEQYLLRQTLGVGIAV
jgi:L-2-hydroxyglutarate oxidase LhgO